MNPLINIFRRGVTPETTLEPTTLEPTTLEPTTPTSFVPKPASSVITAEVIQRELVDRSDELISEARAVLEQVAAPTERMKRLARLGFSSAPEVEEQHALDAKTQKHKAIADLYETYALKYPSLKFIDEATMEVVCKKYGLLLGELYNYIGKVPDWVLDRIEQCGVDVIMYEARHHQNIGRLNWGMDNSSGFHPEAVNTNGMFSTRDEAQRAVDAMEKHTGYVIEHNLMCIAAPKAEMRLRSNERVEGHRIVQEDPIISIRVQGGYCVIAAWGEEGSDPQVFNVANN